jgi:dynein heavy chain
MMRRGSKEGAWAQPWNTSATLARRPPFHHRREVNRPLPPERDEARYLVFDGDVDAVWVENMNSVMDDNKLLTLPNGERIRLQPHVKLLFEVADLQYASPATISRCVCMCVAGEHTRVQPLGGCDTGFRR